MTKIYITDFNCISAFGIGNSVLWDNLAAGRNALKPVKRFETCNYVNNIAGTCDFLDNIECGQRFPAMLEMLFEGVEVSSDAILLTATTKDNIELLELKVRNQEKVEPVNTIDKLLSKRLSLTSPVRNFNTACASGSTALMVGCELISSGRAEEVIVSGCDIVSEFVFSGFSALKAMSGTISRPFDSNRDGLILGESAAYIILMSEKRMKERQLPDKGQIVGWGGSSDAFHITAPHRDGLGLQRAVNKSLVKSGLDKTQIVAINAHGTGTIFNDAMEITAFREIWGGDMPYIYSIKGAIGHCIGPCGLLEVITSLLSFSANQLPETAGNETPEPEIAKSMSKSKAINNTDFVLSVNSGFGGVNTALILSGSQE